MRALRRNRVETEEDFPARRGRTAAACWARCAAASAHRHAWGGHAGADLAAGLQPVLGAAGGRARTALCLCLALRAAHAAAGLELYRSLFRPSATLAKPYVVIGVPLIAAPTDEEAEFLASSTYQRVLGILTGNRQRLQPPVADFMAQADPAGARGDCRFPGRP
jgi:alkanesulfonate monooxygenase SsuD/methylene tetrahydromethanopterin reductase-like flavin-dependent oxidoreductase (luciferase family)